MKIVLCANTSWYLYNYHCHLIAAIQDHGHEVVLISPYDKYTHKLITSGIKWFHLPLHQTSKNPFRELYSIVHLGNMLRKIHPNMVLTFTIKCNLYVGLFTYLFSYTVIPNISGLGEVFSHQTFMMSFVCFLYRLALKHSPKAFFQNEDDLHIFLQQRIVSPQICERLPGSGVDLATFTPSLQQKKNHVRIFLMFGRLLPQKGYDLFLEAARKITQLRPNSAEFWVLGIQDHSRKESQTLFQKILQYHHQHIITYFPATDNVFPLLQQADVVVLPSRYQEGVPKSLLEALACGKPIITTNWKGCRETVEHGMNGYLLDSSELHELEKYLQFFIDTDEKTLHQMGRVSRKKAEEEYDENIVLTKYLAEIQKGIDT